ncbi:bleomycin resistance protein [Thaumasiovibrio subtropicus]|uniref:bleomycin resistance protein n=1 Tax=Thaumasiovibrio subtropicus TaxID=1891207 RepID=UPI000B35D132|nr:VOC family protein [Thaumasiovibrio subtropicus]
MRVVPELYCNDIDVSKAFFVDVLNFQIKYERPEEQFAYLTLDGVDLMLEGLNSGGRKWLTGNMDLPFGRGINLQWDVSDIDRLFERVSRLAPNSVYMQLESKVYECGSRQVEQKQFIVQSPDGYLFRFCQDTE